MIFLKKNKNNLATTTNDTETATKNILKKLVCFNYYRLKNNITLYLTKKLESIL